MVTPRSFPNACGIMCVFWSLGLGLSASSAQEVFNTDLKRDRVLEVAHEIVKNARHCALITVDRSGRPVARTMDPAPPGADFVVWMATNPASEKVQQIGRDPRVTLYYFDPETQGYVSLMGRARLVKDPEGKAKHWREAWNKFYPNRESALLIAVTPEKLETVSPKNKIVGDPKTWAPPTIVFERPPAEPKKDR
jgi:general stress protein 26